MSGEESPFTPYEIQRALGVAVDGKWGPVTERAARMFLGDPKDNTNRPWTRKRLVLGVQQKIMADAGIKIEVDGLPGLETFSAFDKWRAMTEDKACCTAHDALIAQDTSKPLVDISVGIKIPTIPTVDMGPTTEAGMLDFSVVKAIWNWFTREEKTEPAPVVIKPAETVVKTAVTGEVAKVEVKPAILQPNTWPRQKDVVGFYGQHGKVKMVKVPCPWQLELAWDPNTKVSGILIHEKCAASLARVLKAQVEHYGIDGLRALGVHRYGGSFNDRPIRGSNNWSMHSYGIAIDWDPDNNQMKWDHTKARLAKPDAETWWKTWESEGWVSLGKERDFDWMHIQSARL